MEKNKKKQIATNVSSGAEKVEKIEKTVKKTQAKPTSAKEKQIKTDVKNINMQTADEQAEQEHAEAKARVEKALKKKEEKMRQKEEKEKIAKEKAEKKKIAAEKRAAEHKARAEKRAEKRKARLEQQQQELESLQRERAHAKAKRHQEKSKHQNAKHRNEREHGYGGWLAAVVVLGAVTLGLTTALTVGAMEMSNMNNGMLSGYRATTYELVGVAQHVDDDLDRVRISSSAVQQDRILTDLLVQARLAEADLERLPVCAESNCHLTKFFNRVAKESERMLAKLRRGEKLTAQDEEKLQEMYLRAHAVTEELSAYAENMTDKDLMSYVKKGEGAIKDLFGRLEEKTLPENGEMMPGIMPRIDGAGMGRTPIQGEEGGSPQITPVQAEEMCKTYFSDYKINEFQCIGETLARGYTAYNVQGYDDNGTLLFAELDYKNGELIRFDYFEPCEGENFDMENAQMIAEQFLSKLGYDNVTAVRVRENGTDVDFSYVFDCDGIVYYPDLVHVKICRSRGVVTGFDASKYLKNHTNRGELEFRVSMESAQKGLHDGLEVESSRAAVVNTRRGERSAYEFVCAYDSERYVIYIDANTGEELSILNVKQLG